MRCPLYHRCLEIYFRPPPLTQSNVSAWTPSHQCHVQNRPLGSVWRLRYLTFTGLGRSANHHHWEKTSIWTSTQKCRIFHISRILSTHPFHPASLLWIWQLSPWLKISVWSDLRPSQLRTGSLCWISQEPSIKLRATFSYRPLLRLVLPELSTIQRICHLPFARIPTHSLPQPRGRWKGRIATSDTSRRGGLMLGMLMMLLKAKNGEKKGRYFVTQLPDKGVEILFRTLRGWAISQDGNEQTVQTKEQIPIVKWMLRVIKWVTRSLWTSYRVCAHAELISIMRTLGIFYLTEYDRRNVLNDRLELRQRRWLWRQVQQFQISVHGLSLWIC